MQRYSVAGNPRTLGSAASGIRCATASSPPGTPRLAPPLPDAPAFQHLFLVHSARWRTGSARTNCGSRSTTIRTPTTPIASSPASGAQRAVTKDGPAWTSIAQWRATRAAREQARSRLSPNCSASPGQRPTPSRARPQWRRRSTSRRSMSPGRHRIGNRLRQTEAALWRFARMYEAGLVDGLYFVSAHPRCRSARARAAD